MSARHRIKRWRQRRRTQFLPSGRAGATDRPRCRRRVPWHGGREGLGGTTEEASQVRRTVWADSGGERRGIKRKHFLGKDISSTYLGCREEGQQPQVSLRKQGLRRHHVLARSWAHTNREALQARNATLKKHSGGGKKQEMSVLSVNVPKNLNVRVFQESETLRTVSHIKGNGHAK